MTEKDNIFEEKLSKAKVIEGMLDELGMSRQELIDLIKTLMEQSISEDKGQELSEIGAKIDLKELTPQDGEIATGENLTVDQLAAYIANGNTEYISKYLSLEQLKKLNIKIGLAFNLRRAIELGLALDMKAISNLLGINNISKFLPNGNYIADGKEQKLSTEQAGKLSKDINTLVNNRQAARSQNLDTQTLNQLSQVSNDPNDLSNQNSSVNVVKRLVSSIRMQMQNLGEAAGSALSPASGQVAQQQQQQQQQLRQLQNTVNNIQRINSQMRKHERNLKKMFPELGQIQTRGKEVFASVKTKTGEVREVNLKDHLGKSGRLNAKVEKLIDNISDSNQKIEKGLLELSKGLPDAKSFQLDASGKLNVHVETDKTLKVVNLTDYITDLRHDLQRMKSKLEAKKEELQGKKNEADGNIERARDLTRGPELDKASLESAKAVAEKEYALRLQSSGVKSENQTEKTEKKESKRMGDELVKLDVLHDRTKMLESMKSNPEIKQIESSMKEVMKDMKEAEKNKDLVKDMQLAKKDRFLDKV